MIDHTLHLHDGNIEYIFGIGGFYALLHEKLGQDTEDWLIGYIDELTEEIDNLKYELRMLSADDDYD